jgi:hypothetical protein
MNGRQKKKQDKIKKCFIYEHGRKIKKITIKKINKK